jgi:hypothetical protein
LRRYINYDVIPTLLWQLKQKTGFPSELCGVIAEVARDEKNQALKRRFGDYAHQYEVGDHKGKAYELAIPYLQPQLKVGGANPPVAQDLILVPGSRYQVLVAPYDSERKIGRRYKVSKMHIVIILKFLYLRMYGECYEGTEHHDQYFSYLEQLFAFVEQGLEEMVELIEL